MTVGEWVRTRIVPRGHWAVYLWAALLPFQLPLERGLGVRLALSDVALALAVAGAIVVWILEGRALRDLRCLRTSLDGRLAVIAAVIGMGLVVAWIRFDEWTAYTLVNKGMGLLVLIASFYLVVGLGRDRSRWKRVAAAFTGSASLVNVASLGLYGAWLQWGVRSVVIHGNGRMTGFLIDPNAHGGLLTVALLLQLGWLAAARSRARWTRVLGAANALLLGAGLLLTRSRSAWVALAVGLVALGWLIRRSMTWRRAAVAAAAVAGAGAAVWLWAGETIARLLTDALRGTTVLMRWEQVSGGLRLFPSSPIWGNGLDAYRRLGGAHIIHNTYVWFLVEMGVIGFAALVALLWRVGRNWAAALRASCDDWWLAVGGAAAFAAMLGLALGVEAFYQRPLWLLFAMAEGLRRARVPVRGPSGSSDPPRILFVSTVTGMIRAFLVPHMEMLRAKGWAVEIAGNPGRRSGTDALVEAGYRVHPLPFQRRLLAFGNIAAVWWLRRLLRDGQYDIVHVHSPVAGVLARLAARTVDSRAKVLYTAHGFHFFRGAPWYYWALYYPAERLAARWTDGLIVMNEEDFDHGLRLGFVARESLSLVHGVGVDLEVYGGQASDRGRIRREMGCGEGEILITCVAEFIPRKNHRFLLEAWGAVESRCEDARLLLVGTGQLLDDVRREVRRRSNQRVHVLGFRRDVPEILRASDALVLTSKHEGLARCIMEAMAAGLPVVTTNVRGSRDLVEDEVTGLLVEPGDVRALVAALVRIIQSPDLRIRMGTAGRERIEACALDRVLDEMWAIYRTFMS